MESRTWPNGTSQGESQESCSGPGRPEERPGAPKLRTQSAPAQSAPELTSILQVPNEVTEKSRKSQKSQVSPLGVAFDIVYDVVTFLLGLLLTVFFREIKVRSSHQVPLEGPVIFVIAPHANQFVDPLMLMTTCKRRPGFLTAEKTMKRHILGFLAKILGSISVTRQNDIATKASGNIMFSERDWARMKNAGDLDETPSILRIVGDGTKFTSEIKEGMMIVLPGNKGASKITTISSDTELVVDKPFEESGRDLLDPSTGGTKFKIAPVIDQRQMFGQVYERLRRGGTVGIFPEGGSHDRPDLLPLKAGVAIIALGAMSMHEGLDVKIVPCGLSYFNRHKFRSRAVIEYGNPLTIPPELVKTYAKGGAHKRAATDALLKQIEVTLRNVIVTAPDYQTLMSIQAVRRLYQPVNQKLTVGQKLELTRRLVKGYIKYREDPRVQDLEKKVERYNDALRIHGLMDHQVNQTAIEGPRALVLLLWRLFLLLGISLAILPGGLVNAPIFLLAKVISRRKQKEALASSTVKVEGRDVLASWKLLVTLVVWPVLNAFYAAIGWMLAIFYFDMGPTVRWLGGPVAFLAVQMLSYVALLGRDHGFDIYRSLAPLLHSIFPTRWNSSQNLRLARRQLQRDINVVIDELGPQMYSDFGNLVKRDPMASLRQKPKQPGSVQRVGNWVSQIWAGVHPVSVPQNWDLSLEGGDEHDLNDGLLQDKCRRASVPAKLDQLSRANSLDTSFQPSDSQVSLRSTTDLNVIETSDNIPGINIVRRHSSEDLVTEQELARPPHVTPSNTDLMTYFQDYVAPSSGRSSSSSMASSRKPSSGALGISNPTDVPLSKGTTEQDPRSGASLPANEDDDDDGIVIGRPRTIADKAKAKLRQRFPPSPVPV